jgi:tRNA pseudouridine(55) synthase
VNEDAESAAPLAEPRQPPNRRPPRLEINGWINLDKPVGVTSTQAVAQLKRLYNAKKVGHAGTLDPLASGVLPVAFGEATKTVPVVQDGTKAYEFVVRWGEETDTDDAEGRIVARSEARPDRQHIEAALPRFVGLISQTPPTYSAVRIAGERAYDLARGGESFEIAARDIVVHRLTLIEAERDEARFEAECGKGAYVRALARDLGRLLGCGGHVVFLRRTRVGPFSTATAHQSCGAAKGCCCAAPACRPKGRLMPPVSARRSPMARSKRAISSRPGSSICRCEADYFQAPHFQAARASLTIRSPSAPFSKVSLAMRSSPSSSGKSNQPRLAMRSTLWATSASPRLSPIRK